MKINNIKVYKFGGASLKDAKSLKNAADILKNYGHTPLILIVSAMGKTTNLLEKIHNAWFKGNRQDAFILFDELKQNHKNIIDDLFSNTSEQNQDIEDLFNTLYSELEKPAEISFDESYDKIISFGERISSAILAAYLAESKFSVALVDVRELIVTDTNFRDATVNWDATQERIQSCCETAFEQSEIIVTQGFIGGSEDGRVTTLGREGSDFSAAVFAFCTDAMEMHIWKDVRGVLNADPKIMPEAEFLPHLSYRESVELAYYGASVIHPKTIKPLENKNIPLFVRSFLTPELSGTCINKDVKDDRRKASFIFKFNQILISVMPKDFSFINERNLSDIFSLLSKNNIRVRMMQNSAVSFSFCCNNDKAKMSVLLKDLMKRFKVRYNDEVELITIRYYKNAHSVDVVKGRKIFLEQKSRSTRQIIVKTDVN